MEGSTIITINTKGIILSVDKNCCKLFGYGLEELVGNNLTKIIPTPYKEQHDAYIMNYLQTQVPKIIGKNRVVEGQHKDGIIFPIRLSVSKVGDGEDTVFIGMVDKLEDKSASLTINTSGIIVSCNQLVEEIFGYRPNELTGNNINMLMPSPHKEKHNSYLANYSKGGDPKVIGHVRNVPAKHKNGTVFPVSLQVEHIKMGAIELFRGKVEKVDSMEAVFSIDKSGIIVSCNHNFVLPLFGYTSSELIGRNISQLIPLIHQSTNEENPTVAEPPPTIYKYSADNEPSTKKQRKNEVSSAPANTVSPYLNNSGSGSGSSSYTDSSTSTNVWKQTGVHRKELRHKDGSIFPVNLEIIPFQTNEGKELYSGRIRRADILPNDSMADDSQLKLIGDYYVSRTIGQGTYGKVKLAYHKNSKSEVAIKILSKSSMKDVDMERARREVEILRKLSHPNICKLYDVIETEDTMNIVMEYAPGTLLSYVMERGGLVEIDAHRFFAQIVSAIEYCHRSNIIHRDIKHQNILLGEREQVKIIDFGLSNFIAEGHLRSTFCGTPAYAAPEMILGKKYLGPEVDIWSMGVVLYSMITGQFPFENVSDIISGTFKDPKNVTPECCNILRKMFQVDVAQRACLNDIINDPWVRNGPTTNQIKTIECTVVDTTADDKAVTITGTTISSTVLTSLDNGKTITINDISEARTEELKRKLPPTVQ